MFMNLAYIHIMSNKIKFKKTSYMKITHSFGIRVSKHSQRNSFPISFLYSFYIVAMEAYYALWDHLTTSYVHTSIITLSY